jgi:hypothetical protein
MKTVGLIALSAPGLLRALLVREAAVPAQTDDRRIAKGWIAADGGNELEAIHPRQRQVRDQEVDAPLVKEREPSLSVGRSQDVERDPEELGVHGTGIFVILDQEHR